MTHESGAFCMPTFPYGRAAFALLMLGVVAGPLSCGQRRRRRKTATLTMWTFAKPHYLAYLKTIPAFEKAHPGVKVDLELVDGHAVGDRLQASFWANLEVPDMVETEISTAGSFFRGPAQRHRVCRPHRPNQVLRALRKNGCGAIFALYQSGQNFRTPARRASRAVSLQPRDFQAVPYQPRRPENVGRFHCGGPQNHGHQANGT